MLNTKKPPKSDPAEPPILTHTPLLRPPSNSLKLAMIGSVTAEVYWQWQHPAVDPRWSYMSYGMGCITMNKGGKIRELAILDWGYLRIWKASNYWDQWRDPIWYRPHWPGFLGFDIASPARLHLWDEEEIFSSSSQLKEAFQYMGSHPFWGYQFDPSCTEDDWKKPLIVGQSLGDLTISARRNKESVSKGSCSSVSGTPHKMCFESMALLESPAANSSFLWAANL